MGRLERDVFPYLGNLRADAVTAPLVLEIIRRVEARGTIETAHRTKHHISCLISPDHIPNHIPRKTWRLMQAWAWLPDLMRRLTRS